MCEPRSRLYSTGAFPPASANGRPIRTRSSSALPTSRRLQKSTTQPLPPIAGSGRKLTSKSRSARCSADCSEDEGGSTTSLNYSHRSTSSRGLSQIHEYILGRMQEGEAKNAYLKRLIDFETDPTEKPPEEERTKYSLRHVKSRLNSISSSNVSVLFV